MISKSAINQNKTRTNVLKTVINGSQNTGSFGMAPRTHSIEYRQAHVFKTGIPPHLSVTTTPVVRLQACLDENVSGVSMTRNQMLESLYPMDAVIDRMSEHDVVMKSAFLNFDIRGPVKHLRRLLKNYYNRQRISHNHLTLSSSDRMQFDFLVVIDFEATCAQYNDSFVQEIIEFPAVLVDVRYQVVRSYYRSYCKPKVNPVLTDFCTSLTGITQAQVNQAKSFKDVLENFEEWLNMQQLGTAYKFAVVTDGPWDMAKFLKCQLELSDLDLPHWATQWVNIRKVFRAFYDCDGYVNLRQMVSQSGLQFWGRPHCGLDDSLNIAAVVMKLLQEGCVFTFNEYFRPQQS